MRTGVFGGAMVLALAVADQARANMLVNGSLETTNKLNVAKMIYMSTTRNTHDLSGWTISSGTIDIVSTKVLKSDAGNFAVDLIGTAGLGGIEQTVPTTNGTQYTLTFDFSVNPAHRPKPHDELTDTKVLQVQVIDGAGSGNQEDDEPRPAIGSNILASQIYTATAGTRTRTNMQYISETFSFTGTGDPVTLVLSALTPLNMGPKLNSANVRCGPVIDNLDLEIGGAQTRSVPEPASLGLLGLGSLLLARRGTRKRV